MSRRKSPSLHRQAGMADEIPLILLILIYGTIGFIFLAVIGSVFGVLKFIKNPKVKAIALFIVVGFWGILWWEKLYIPKKENELRADARQTGIKMCRNDLGTLSGNLSVDSLLIESGILETDRLRQLIGERGLKFVELRPKMITHHADKPKQLGVATVHGDEVIPLYVSPEVKIVRVTLSKLGDEGCKEKENLGFNVYGRSAPLAPDACYRIDLDNQSRASHALRAVPIPEKSGFIKWTILEQSTGKILAALSSSDRPNAPVRQGGGSSEDFKKFDGNYVSCLQPHFSLMNLVYGPPKNKEERLALAFKKVVPTSEIDTLEDPSSWPSVSVPEQDVTGWSGKSHNEARNGKPWKEAYRDAEREGWASYEESVIDFNAGQIISLERPKPAYGYIARVRGSKDGFILVWNWAKGPNGVPVVHYSLDGQVLWKHFLASERTFPENVQRFDPVGVEWDKDQLRVYGFRRDNIANESNVTVLTLKLPIRSNDK